MGDPVKSILPALGIGGLFLLVLLGYWLADHSSSILDEQEEVRELAVNDTCDPIAEACRAMGDDAEFSFHLAGPVKPLKPFDVEVKTGLNAQAVTLRFDMVGMDMGVNQYRLQVIDKGVWQAQVMLPVCVTGRRDWFATVRVTVPGDEAVEAKFPFETQ